MPSAETTAKRGGLLSSGRGGRWLMPLLSPLLSARRIPCRRGGELPGGREAAVQAWADIPP
jgi:hypothetical protein